MASLEKITREEADTLVKGTIDCFKRARNIGAAVGIGTFAALYHYHVPEPMDSFFQVTNILEITAASATCLSAIWAYAAISYERTYARRPEAVMKQKFNREMV
jgi:hypothetical protein